MSILIGVFVYIYIKIKFDFKLASDKIAQFLQKLQLNWDKNKNTGTKLIMRKWHLT